MSGNILLKSVLMNSKGPLSDEVHAQVAVSNEPSCIARWGSKGKIPSQFLDIFLESTSASQLILDMTAQYSYSHFIKIVDKHPHLLIKLLDILTHSDRVEECNLTPIEIENLFKMVVNSYSREDIIANFRFSSHFINDLINALNGTDRVDSSIVYEISEELAFLQFYAPYSATPLPFRVSKSSHVGYLESLKVLVEDGKQGASTGQSVYLKLKNFLKEVYPPLEDAVVDEYKKFINETLLDHIKSDIVKNSDQLGVFSELFAMFHVWAGSDFEEIDWSDLDPGAQNSFKRHSKEKRFNKGTPDSLVFKNIKEGYFRCLTISAKVNFINENIDVYDTLNSTESYAAWNLTALLGHEEIKKLYDSSLFDDYMNVSLLYNVQMPAGNLRGLPFEYFESFKVEHFRQVASLPEVVTDKILSGYVSAEMFNVLFKDYLGTLGELIETCKKV